MKLPIHLAMQAVSATLFDADEAPMELHVSTDTRTLEPGDTFVALRGERCDGHDFVAEAVRRGAAMTVVDRLEARAPGAASMVVQNTLSAYMALAGLARELFEGRVIAITGSAGKTTTKALLVQLLEARYGDRVTAAPGNENNEIGVSKLLLGVSNDEHDVAVVEMGARRYGDIAALVAIVRPEAGILTNVGDAHLEIMGSRERLEETKWALFGRGARAVLNAGDAVSRRRASSLAQPPHWFAADSATTELPAGWVTALIGDRLIDARPARTTEHVVDVRVPGRHNRANLAAALAGALDLDVSVDAMIAKIADVRLPAGRYQAIALASGLRIIYDAYNANASGTMAALDAFAGEAARRRIAVLGSMAELGDESERLHERVGAHAAATKVDVLLVGGEFAEALARGAGDAGLPAQHIVHVATNADAARWLRENAGGGDVVLLKGSRKYKLEEIVEELQA